MSRDIKKSTNKVLGYTNNGGLDWFLSSPYTSREIQGIPDPDGGHALNAPTAVPSPFARMDLVRKSFETIINSPELKFLEQKGRVLVSKEDEKLVSQCLDLAEILFFYKNYEKNIKIIPWDRNTQINSLINSGQIAHRRFGEALDLYLRQDAHTFNFAEMQYLYLIKFDHQVIGGTSPLTMFFPAAADIALFGLKSSKGRTYFNDIVPLYDRDEKFQRYLYLLFEKHQDELGSSMKALHEYTKRSLKMLGRIEGKRQLFMELNALNVSELDEKYTYLHTTNANQVVEVMGIGLKTINPNEIIDSVRRSDFVIHSSKYNQPNKPLVLQNNFNRKLTYINSIWDSATPVPYFDPLPISQRKPPGQDMTYPYLTFSDFFESNIIQLVYPINGRRYFDGNLQLNNEEETKSYLLPIKSFFFEFFDVEDLVLGGIGKPSISMDETAMGTAVRVQIKIPIANGKDFIVFERIFHKDGTASEKDNKGAIKQHQFGLTVMPFVKFNEAPHYNVHLLDRDVTGFQVDTNYNLNFFSNNSNKPLVITHKRHRTKKQKGDVSKVSSEFYNLQSNFDYIQIDNQIAKGIIIPLWTNIPYNGSQFTFAIDFGTTNTHIEFSVNGNTPVPFNIGQEDVQAVSMVNEAIDHNFSGEGAVDIRTSVLKEFVPELIGGNSIYRFPHRTVISQSKINSLQTGGLALIDYNIPLIFEKDLDNNSKFFTGLKWDSHDLNNVSRVSAFLEELILLIRNKVITNGGNLQLTKIVWTYPASMSVARKGKLQEIWNKLFHQYINPDDNAQILDICESTAPYFYFLSTGQLEGAGYNVNVLMDIGGGTSDVVVYDGKAPKLISSYKFAGNTLFGDGYKSLNNNSLNSLIAKFKPSFDETLTSQSSTLKATSDKIYEEQPSSDYNAFLFSLLSNPEVKRRDEVDYSKKISADKNLKIIFLYFYAAKIYHIAKLMKADGLELPMNMMFSGNGAKILNLISPDYKVISLFTKAIFCKVYNIAEYPANGLKINIEKRFPKEVTCKGALIHALQGIRDIDINKLKRVYTGTEMRTILNQDVNETFKASVVTDIQKFNSIFIDLNREIDFDQYFEAAPAAFEKFKSVVNLHTKSYLHAGIEFNQSLDGAKVASESVIAETLFFYPLVEIIQQLFKELSGLPK